jgi:general secretion pathway protein D
MSLKLRWVCDKTLVRLAIASLVVIIACSAAVGASGSGRGLILDVRDARLADVVLLLTSQSGANIVINPDVADMRVTAMISDQPLETILENVVRNTAGVEFWKTEDGTYIIGGKRPSPAAKQEPVVPVTTTAQYIPAKPVVTREVIKLVHSDPTELLITLGALPSEASLSYRRFLSRNEYTRSEPYGNSILGGIDQDASQTGIFIPQNIGKPDAVAPSIDPGNTMGLNGAGRAATTGEGAGQYPPRPYPGPQPGPQPGPGPRPGPADQWDQNNLVPGTLLPDGVDLVQPFPLDNSIIVRGTEEGIADFKNLVHLLDIPPKQVQIKAEFIEVSTNDVKRLGVDWSLDRLNETISTNFNPGGNVVVGLTTGNLAASLRAELTRNSGNIINSPIISTINNQYAEINIGSNIPYWTTVLVSVGNGQVVQQQQMNQLQVQTYLRVLPRVNGDGTITLTLMPSVQDTGNVYNSPDGNQVIPETRFQTLYTMRRVMNGETIVVGGFIRKNKTINMTQIPILGELPIVGTLFRTTSTATSDRELLIFVTPTIIGDRSAGSSIGVSPSL